MAFALGKFNGYFYLILTPIFESFLLRECGARYLAVSIVTFRLLLMHVHKIHFDLIPKCRFSRRRIYRTEKKVAATKQNLNAWHWSISAAQQSKESRRNISIDILCIVLNFTNANIYLYTCSSRYILVALYPCVVRAYASIRIWISFVNTFCYVINL